MTIDEIIELLAGFEGILIVRPGPGDGSPEISWGDSFFYYAPDGVVPAGQPFATIVTKEYPDEEGSGLDRPGAFRVNVAAAKEDFVRWVGRAPRDPARDDENPSIDDTVIAHPVYGGVGWLAVVNPGGRTESTVRELLRAAYERARARHARRAERSGRGPDDAP